MKIKYRKLVPANRKRDFNHVHNAQNDAAIYLWHNYMYVNAPEQV